MPVSEVAQAMADREQKKKRKLKSRLTIHIGFTQYDVIKDVAEEDFNMKVTMTDDEDWDLMWIDGGIQAYRL